MRDRKSLIEKVGTREDSKLELFNLEQLEELIHNKTNKEGWHCIGRKTLAEGNYVSYCIYAYADVPLKVALQIVSSIKGCIDDTEKFIKDF